ncbi:MAG: thioredoxin reductase (NADPH), partial [bacterium]
MSICYDLIIVGAGPAGISAAYTAKQLSLNYLVIEQKQIASTVYQYPLGKQLFSTANELEFEPNSLHYRDTKPTREELLEYYHNFVYQEQNLSIHTEEAVISIKAGQPLKIITSRDFYEAHNVLVAVGAMGIINKLNVRGETEERVFYFFHSAT